MAYLGVPSARIAAYGLMIVVVLDCERSGISGVAKQCPQFTDQDALISGGKPGVEITGAPEEIRTRLCRIDWPICRGPYASP
jgi:hypothetical protein